MLSFLEEADNNPRVVEAAKSTTEAQAALDQVIKAKWSYHQLLSLPTEPTAEQLVELKKLRSSLSNAQQKYDTIVRSMIADLKREAALSPLASPTADRQTELPSTGTLVDPNTLSPLSTNSRDYSCRPVHHVFPTHLPGAVFFSSADTPASPTLAFPYAATSASPTGLPVAATSASPTEHYPAATSASPTP